MLTLRGELLFKLNQPEPAQTDFREAIGHAQKMPARAWELRAAMSLARMLRVRGKIVEARGLLAPLYSAFTEGFDPRPQGRHGTARRAKWSRTVSQLKKLFDFLTRVIRSLNPAGVGP
jgi:hypothetical protein